MATNYLKQIRRERGIMLKQMAEATGFAVSTINNYENGRSDASQEFLNKLGEVLNIPAEMIQPKELRTSGTPSIQLPDGWRMIPVISWVSAGVAGNFYDLGDVMQEYVLSQTKDPNAFGLIIEGSSMEPEFRGGDLVVAEPNSVARNGDYVVARLAESGDVMFKVFKQRGPEGELVRLESLNPDFAPREFHRKEFRFIYPVSTVVKRLR